MESNSEAVIARIRQDCSAFNPSKLNMLSLQDLHLQVQVLRLAIINEYLDLKRAGKLTEETEKVFSLIIETWSNRNVPPPAGWSLRDLASEFQALRGGFLDLLKDLRLSPLSEGRLSRISNTWTTRNVPPPIGWGRPDLAREVQELREGFLELLRLIRDDEIRNL